MRRLDTSIVVRYLTKDPPDQAAQAARLFAQVADGQVEVVVDEIAIAETVWTLSSYYRLPRRDIAEALLLLLSATGLKCRDGQLVQRALVLFDEKNIDFVDAMICARMLDEGEAEIYSFDRHFDRVSGIRRLEPT